MGGHILKREMTHVKVLWLEASMAQENLEEGRCGKSSESQEEEWDTLRVV